MLSTRFAKQYGLNFHREATNLTAATIARSAVA